MWPLPGSLPFWVRLVCEDSPGVDTDDAQAEKRVKKPRIKQDKL